MLKFEFHLYAHGASGRDDRGVIGRELIVERLDYGRLDIHADILVDIKLVHGGEYVGVYYLQEIDDYGSDYGIVPVAAVIVPVVLQVVN